MFRRGGPGPTEGGMPKKRKAVRKKKKRTISKAKWLATGRKVTIAKRGKPPCKKTLYKNSVTGELRVRKCRTAKDGTRKYVYVTAQ